MTEPHPWNVSPLPPRIDRATWRLTVTAPDMVVTAPRMRQLLDFSAQLEKLGYVFVKLERVESAP